MAETSEEIKQKLEDVQKKFGEFQEKILMTRVRDEIEDIQSTLNLLPGQLKKLRTEGYVFRSYLENKLSVLSRQWGEVESDVKINLQQRVRELKKEASETETEIENAARNPRYHITSAENALEALENKLQAAEKSLTGMYENLINNLRQTQSQLDEIEWMFEQTSSASFQLFPAEDPITACEATLIENNRDGDKGVLYLTDERILFEQKEKVATKKVLFIATEKETVQALVFEEPVGQIEEVNTSQAGLFKGKEILELKFSADADLYSAKLRLRGADNEDWARLIGMVKSGDISKERTKPKDKTAVEKARSAPTKCPSCGAIMEVEIVRGMREITCEYCGSIIRL